MKIPTLAPLPHPAALLQGFFTSTPVASNLSSPWCTREDRSFWYSRSSWSLLALATWRSKVYGSIPRVWFPDYFCNSSLAPLREFGVQIYFYPINNQISPEQKLVEQIFCDIQPDLFVLVHYFGQPTMEVEWLINLCKQQSTWLVEDATHVLRPEEGVGQIGDAVLYSPHKLLPIPDGAVLVVRKDGPNQLCGDEEKWKKLANINTSLQNSSKSGFAKIAIWTLKRLIQSLGIFCFPKRVPFRDDEKIVDRVSTSPKMSKWSQRLLVPLISDLDTVANQRIQNQDAWEKLYSTGLCSAESSLTPLMSHIGTVVPYQAGFFVDPGNRALELYDFMQNQQIPVTTWPDLPPEVTQKKHQHKVAIQLRNHILFFPTHHSISQNHIERYEADLLHIKGKNWQVHELGRNEWDIFWEKCTSTNLLQSWEYGEAKKEAESWQPYRLLISDENNLPIALAQVLVKELPFVGGVARLNRGPLLINNTNPPNPFPDQFIIFSVLRKYAFRKKWWIIRVAPEIEHSDASMKRLKSIGGSWLSRQSPWASGLIDLTNDEAGLFMQLKGKWRTALRKGQKSGVDVISSDLDREKLEELVKDYAALQNSRDFFGLTDAFILALGHQKKSTTWKFNLYFAMLQDSPESRLRVGSLVTVQAGDSCIYLIGITNEIGRKVQANSVLLWESLVAAKQNGCRWFDIGGLSEETPKGIAEFKKGLNATPYGLVGEWVFFPKITLKR